MKSMDLLYLLSDVDEALVLRAGEHEKKHRNLRPLWVLVAVLVFSTAAIAATVSLWSPGLASAFGADETAQEALLNSGMTSMVYGEPVVMENGLKLEVQQVLCDGKEITVSVHYDVPDSEWLSRENRKWAAMLTRPVLTVGGIPFENIGGGFEQNTATDSSAYMIWRFTGDCSGLDGETAVLALSAAGTLHDTIQEMRTTAPADAECIQNDPLILTNRVEFVWILDMSTSISTTREGEFTAEYDGIVYTAEDVVLTPVSIRFTATGSEQNLTERLYETGIILKDGTEIAFSSGRIGQMEAVADETEKGKLRAYFTFERTVLDLDSIVGITYAAFETPEDDRTVFVLPLK